MSQNKYHVLSNLRDIFQQLFWEKFMTVFLVIFGSKKLLSSWWVWKPISNVKNIVQIWQHKIPIFLSFWCSKKDRKTYAEQGLYVK